MLKITHKLHLMARQLPYKYLLLGFLALAVLCGAIRALHPSAQSTDTSTPFPVTHYRMADVQGGIASYPPRSGDSPPVVRGGVVSHHLLAERYIARYFQNLSGHAYRQVVLIGPNHANAGVSDVITSTRRDWDTPYGVVHVARVLPELPQGDAVMAGDHALEVLMPYIKVYLPQASVIPILIKSSVTENELNSLVVKLNGLVGSDTLVLVSSDFSHYLSEEDAFAHDTIALSAIERRDYAFLAPVRADYLDSPGSVIVMLKLMDEIGANKLQVFAHASAATIANTPGAPTTTYYFLNVYE